MAMTTVRFRAWDREEKEMIAWEIIVDDGFEKYLCNPLMQFTGLYDKNDEEIYEGDIVSFLSGKYEVVFKFGAFVLKSIKYPDSCLGKFEHTKNNMIEIIGNIYENPEFVGLRVKGID